MASQEEPKSFAGINLKQDFGYGLSNTSKAPQAPNGELKPGQSQASRAMSLAGYFVSGCMAYVSDLANCILPTFKALIVDIL